MNILKINTFTTQQNSLNFMARQKVVRLGQTTLKPLVTDVIELSTKKAELLPKKLELTPFEENFYEILKERIRLDLDIETQKKNLRSYYSPLDKYEYKELVKKRRALSNQLKRLAKKENVDPVDVEYEILGKKKYNRYAAKVYNAQSIDELREICQLVETNSFIYKQTKEMLYELIEQRAKLL